MSFEYPFKLSAPVLAIGISVVFAGLAFTLSAPGFFREEPNPVPLRPAGWVVVPGVPDRICDIREYGAREGVDFQSTEAINAAVDDCSKNGGGTVMVPKGTWFSGGIELKSDINLFLSEGSEIVFSTDVRDYLPVVLGRFQGMELYNFAPLIYIKDGRNVAITGKGKLVGNGEARTDWDGGGEFGAARERLYAMAQSGVPPEERVFGDTNPGLRPSFIQFVNCRDILLDGFRVENGPFWTIHPVYSENFTARNLTVDTWSGNTDGIVIDSSSNVVIENSLFSTGDDAIAIKSGLDEDGRRVAKASEHISIRNITVTRGNSGVSIGSEMSGGVSDVEVRDSVFKNTRHGFRIKSTDSRGGYIENIRVRDIVMEGISSDVLTLDFAYNSALASDIKKAPSLKDVLISDIRGSGVGNSSADAVINVDGLADAVTEGIRFENISFTSSAEAVHLKNARNISLKNIRIEASGGPGYRIEKGRDIVIEDSVCPEGANPCFLVEGKSTQGIVLKGIDFSNVVRALETRGRVPRQAVTIVDDAS